MKISEIVVTEGWKNFMKYLYGWGASVVLLGALFKIMHWPGASLMLILGMGVEVVIFFFSAFEPLSHDLDWTLVFPELAGIDDDDTMEEKHGGHSNHGLTNKDGGSNVVIGGGEVIQSSAGLKKLETMMDGLDVNSTLFEKLGVGLNKLTQTTNNLSDLSSATVATDKYVDTVNVASESLSLLAESFNKSNETLGVSVGGLNVSYQNAATAISSASASSAQNITTAGTTLLSDYMVIANSIKTSADLISTESKDYSHKIQEVNTKLGALNALYEIQQNETNNHINSSKQIFKGLDKMLNNIEDSAKATQDYKEEVVKLTDNIAELNNIYGNMLSSLNVLKQ